MPSSDSGARGLGEGTSADDIELQRLTDEDLHPRTNPENPLGSCCTRPCCTICSKSPERSRQLNDWCFTPAWWFSFIGGYLLLCLVINLVCPAATISPFYDIGGDADAVALFLCVSSAVIVGGSILFVRRREPERRQAGTVLAKRIAVLIAVYLVVCIPAYYSAKESLYHDVDGGDNGFATEFEFEGMDGVKLKGLTKVMYSSSSSGKDESEITHYPLVFLGGTGINMYGNVYAVRNFLYDWLAQVDEPVAFDYYTFSYRGFKPNTGHLPSEANIKGDSEHIFDYVKELYPGQRPLLFSHSLGTGPTTALLSKFGEDEEGGPACVGLAMPYSSMHQTINELGFYTPLILMPVIDGWNSNKRIRKMNENVPLVILSAGQDELIAPHHQKKQFEAAASNTKKLFYSEDADHNDLRTPITLNLLEHLKFMDSCIARV
ncbi:hypothetical protein TrVE_jg10778 [Triparma verrucosa]|uniref:Serine aminopeptidase S33 domain-containing protein n=1 Tax=Triparma verrucosa TaxID=1606542 RepID=A0A9W7BMY1_9STRA|nr:hypothetical protein TrVE_jg10778 [Triparma verrucosa]